MVRALALAHLVMVRALALAYLVMVRTLALAHSVIVRALALAHLKAGELVSTRVLLASLAWVRPRHSTSSRCW